MGFPGVASLAAVLTLSLQIGGWDRRAPSPLDSGEILEVDVRAPAGTRTLSFRLVQRDPRTGRPRTVGVSRWTIGCPEPRGILDAVHGWAPVRPPLRIETQTTWFDVDSLVVQVEESGPRGRSLIWREVRERGGRVLWLSEAAHGGFQSTEPVGRDLVRRPQGDVDLVLHRVEEARRGSPIEACLTRFQPLEQQIEELEARTFVVGSGRILELRRADGSLAGRYAYEGEELVSYQLSEGGPVAEPIASTEYQALLRSHAASRRR